MDGGMALEAWEGNLVRVEEDRVLSEEEHHPCTPAPNYSQPLSVGTHLLLLTSKRVIFIINFTIMHKYC